MKLKRNILISIFLLLIINFVQSVPINFQKGTWAEVLAKAKKEKKKIFVDAFATWCGPCKKMEANTFSNDKVGDFFNANFICYKLDMESPEGRKFGLQFPVSMYPTFLFFDETGKKIAEYRGYRDPDNFLATARNVVYPEQSEIYKLTKQYESGERNKKFLYKLLIAKNDENQTADPKIISEYFMGIPPDSLVREEPFVIFYMYHDSIESAYTNFFIANYKMLNTLFGNYASNKVDNMINNNIKIAARNKDKVYLDKIKKFAANFVEKERIPEIEQQMDKMYNTLLTTKN